MKRLHHQLVLFGRYHCKAKSPNCEICKLKDMDSQKWVKVSEKELLDAVPLNTTVTMILKGRTIVDFYKESYEPTPIISSYSKTEKTLVSRKEISYDEFQEYMKNFEGNDRENK